MGNGKLRHCPQVSTRPCPVPKGKAGRKETARPIVASQVHPWAPRTCSVGHCLLVLLAVFRPFFGNQWHEKANEPPFDWPSGEILKSKWGKWSDQTGEETWRAES